jgi:DNA topoisomerase-1
MYNINSMNKDKQIQKKYIYDPVKEAHKQCHLLEFSKILPKLRMDIRQHLDRFNYSHDDVVYLILAIIDLCHFRVGNTKYKDSTGISTLKRGHLDKCNSGSTSCSSIQFNGKRQVVNTCQILNEKMNKILMTMAEYKSDDDFFFTYVDLNGKTQRVNAESINELLRRYGEITTKMFRTWKANYYFIKTIKRLEVPHTKSSITKNISTAVGVTAERLYHTKAICRRSYIDSRIVNFYKEYPLEFLETISDTPNTNPYLLDGESDLVELLGEQCSM